MPRGKRKTPGYEPKPVDERKIPKIAAIQLAPSEWGVASGYGRTALSLFRVFQDASVTVGAIGRPKIVGEGGIFPEPIKNADTVLHIGNPPDWKPVAGARNFGFCWWPFSKMPAEWVRPLNGVEAIIVPSEWNRNGAVLPNPNKKVHVAPLGVDGSTFEPYRRERGDKLRILFMAGDAGSYRDGGDIAVAAFRAAFPEKREDVLLDIWSTARFDLDMPDMRIQAKRHIGSDQDLVRLLQRYDALLVTSRGTGFGLVPIEAMATGMPVFHCGQGALEPIADLGILIGAHRRPTFQAAQAGAECYEPLYEVTATCLRRLDTDYDALQERAMQDAQTVRERFTWQKTARAVLEAIR